MFCYIGVDPSKGYTPEQLIERAANGLYLQWDIAQVEPAVRSFVTWNYGRAQNAYMASVLDSVDVVADIFGGRATETALGAHFTGDPAVFSRSIAAVKNVDLESMRNFANQYLTRERMVAGVVDPLDAKERMRLEAEAAGRFTVGDRPVVRGHDERGPVQAVVRGGGHHAPGHRTRRGAPRSVEDPRVHARQRTQGRAR